MVFTHEIDFDPGAPGVALESLPTRPAVFSLRGVSGEPYLNRTADLRRRLAKLLTPAPAQSKRLQLASLVRRIAWVETASDFDAQLLLYRASNLAFGARASKRLHLFTPFFLRMGMRNRYPRAWVTNAITLAAADDLFGPFPSRASAERYLEQVFDLYLLRRCFQDLDPDPQFPGCIYSEMKKCLAPCFGGCSDERYAEEAAAVHAFLRTNGESLMAAVALERDRASEALDFEGAAAAHARYSKAESVAALAPDLARPLSLQRAVVVQPSAEPDHVSLYLLDKGTFAGPVLFSVLGMRLPNEQSGSSSLFAHPAAFAAVPLTPQPGEQEPAPDTPDERLRHAVRTLVEQAVSNEAARSKEEEKQLVCDHQALLARWYFRPQNKREGELLFASPSALQTSENGPAHPGPNTGPAEAGIALKPLLRASARVYKSHVERHAPAQVTPTV